MRKLPNRVPPVFGNFVVAHVQYRAGRALSDAEACKVDDLLNHEFKNRGMDFKQAVKLWISKHDSAGKVLFDSIVAAVTRITDNEFGDGGLHGGVAIGNEPEDGADEVFYPISKSVARGGGRKPGAHGKGAPY